MLPCKHNDAVVDQVQPTIDLLTRCDELHPDILLEHDIEPADYNGNLVFRSAVESIRGSFVASSTTERERYVARVLQRLQDRALIVGFQQLSSQQRYDFAITVEQKSGLHYFAALEVKGGEGNSINISERPPMAQEFCVWCHLDGAIRNQPSHGAHSIINRLANEMVRRHKQVDVVFFKDSLCGSTLRVCPKYGDMQDNAWIAPDVVLLPQRIPTVDDPQPPVHTLETVRLPRLFLEAFEVAPHEMDNHVWYVDIVIEQQDDQRLYRVVSVLHRGNIVDESRSRSWRID